MKISPTVTKVIYETRNELDPFLRKLDYRILSKYNAGYLKYQKEPTRYFVDVEINRFLHTVDYIHAHFPKPANILDIGVFIPILPIGLAKLGYQVCAVEKLSLYKNTLDPLLQYAREKYGIVIYDIDIINDDTSHLLKQFDAVLLMAILEHLNGSPRRLLEKCKDILKPSGSLFVDVPNIASVAKRASLFLKGNSPLPNYSDYFWSDYPYEGHNREYNFRELEYALTETGFEICRTIFLNVESLPDASFPSRILKVFSKFCPPTWREVIWTVSRHRRG